MKSEPQFSRRERQIMDVLHTRGRATAAEVLAALPDPPSYSAIRALLRILEQKGHARHLSENNRYVYLPRVSRQAASRSALKRVVSTFFGGSISDAMAALLATEDAELSNEEIHRLENLIAQAKKEGH
jgi:BlaI family penicillinase repressor